MPSEPSYPLAPLGRRACAWLLDVGLGVVLALGFVDLAGGRRDLTAAWQLVAFKSVKGQSGHQLSAAMSPSGMNLAAMKPVLGLLLMLAVVAGAGVAYRVVTTAVWGAGIGKWLLGIRVIVDAPGPAATPTTPGWARAWKRWAVPQAPGLIPLPATSLLAYLPAARDHRRRGLHDRAAGTIVVDVRSGRVEPAPAPAEPAREPWRLAALDGYPTLDGHRSPVAVRALAGASE
jgi:hypothetical protein